MTLEQLIEEARTTSATFNQKYFYWTVTRNRKPSMDWLFKNLVEALGVEVVEASIKSEERKNETNTL